MNKTVLITGASTGIGRDTALYFSKKGWNVAATMRNPHAEKELNKLSNIKIYKLDVTSEATIIAAVESAIKEFGGIDVLVNNAGYGAVGIFEKSTPEEIRKQFDVNVFGLMEVTRAVLPHFRSKKEGIIINISSVGGRVTFPIYSVYNATKWAVEGFSESLQFELRQFGIRVKLVEPGAIKTDFYSRSQTFFRKEGLSDYDNYEFVTMKNTRKFGEVAPSPEIVAKTVFKAATNKSFKLRYTTGLQPKMLLFIRAVLPLNWFLGLVRSQVEAS